MTATAGQSDTDGDVIRFAARTDTGTQRPHNEDACGSQLEGVGGHVVIAVADGVSGLEGGEVASRMAVDGTLRAYRLSPAAWGPAKRLHRAVQQANIEIHDRALIVSELRGMSTTLTACVIEGGVAHAAHVGDSRLYLLRDGRMLQKTKDHTVAADKRRLGLISAERLKDHPERSTLTRSLGRELIAAIDRISFPLQRGDSLLLCSDGLYNVLGHDEIRELAGAGTCDEACAALVDAANARGTPDNVTAAVVRVASLRAGPAVTVSGWRALVARILGT